MPIINTKKKLSNKLIEDLNQLKNLDEEDFNLNFIELCMFEKSDLIEEILKTPNLKSKINETYKDIFKFNYFLSLCDNYKNNNLDKILHELKPDISVNNYDGFNLSCAGNLNLLNYFLNDEKFLNNYKDKDKISKSLSDLLINDKNELYQLKEAIYLLTKHEQFKINNSIIIGCLKNLSEKTIPFNKDYRLNSEDINKLNRLKSLIEFLIHNKFINNTIKLEKYIKIIKNKREIFIINKINLEEIINKNYFITNLNNQLKTTIKTNLNKI